MNYANFVGARIKAARDERGLTQQNLADALDISRSQFTHYETGRTLISLEYIKRLESLLDVSGAWLLGYNSSSIADLSPIEQDVVRLMQGMEGKGRESVFDYAQYLVGKFPRLTED